MIIIVSSCFGNHFELETDWSFGFMCSCDEVFMFVWSAFGIHLKVLFPSPFLFGVFVCVCVLMASSVWDIAVCLLLKASITFYGT